ncbi:MiaB/RimO family radical SAM methylthiotransferase [Treponema sp. OMZ 791]|uniref:30S ribosomal protein S12 methylthiotransferase RimO n=1 Tax=unclassified Treponema TaxID=2638727 RepID=UPI0021F9C87E|nr:30S ribosomal protein S12 methylthiotransferase RimO [Treponema sp. OMZ 789]UTC71228.1 30S ribosomal protein S12 methylthiotransferase RimO [Treponema sp. OMZ 790]UTC73946.1 30S ribosomal protein S12 methylthiotransferase RimO [Treponema sp. OMZ 791]
MDLHGCAKNQVDAELIIGIMENLSWNNTSDPDEADLIIVNSCGFINSAKEESINAVLQAKAAHPKAKILLAGCLAERYAEVLKTDLPEADGIFGNGNLSLLPEIIDAMYPKKTSSKKIVKKTLIPPQIGVCGGERPKILNFPHSAYIKITEGCDNFCSFCAIPIIRGRLRSRPVKDICNEIKDFIKKDFYEFNLIGQDLAAYQTGKDDIKEHKKESNLSGLAFLLKTISQIKGDFKIRLLYIHPDHFPQDILPIMTADNRFLPYFDIPFQSGAQNIIQAMNRKGSAESYLEIVQKIRNAFKDAKSPYGEPQIRTTFLTGFPGETDEDFNETINFLKELKPLWSGGFTYSREEDTASYSFKNRVNKKTAQNRLAEIQDIQTGITEKILDSFIGKEIEVFVEELIPEDDTGTLALGRAWFQAPEVDGAVVLNFTSNKKDIAGKTISPGSIVKAKITGRSGFDIEAVAV